MSVCLYGKDCHQDSCRDCPIMADDDGRQSILDEICADYRTAVKLHRTDLARNALDALRREILELDMEEWTLEELEKALRPLVTGKAWRTRPASRKLAWVDLVESLQRDRSGTVQP